MWANWSLRKRLIVSTVGLFSLALGLLLLLISMSQYQLYKDQLRNNYKAQLNILSEYLSVYVEFNDTRSLKKSSEEWVKTVEALGLHVNGDKSVLFSTDPDAQCEPHFSLMENRVSVEYEMKLKGRFVGSLCATWSLDDLRALLWQNGSILLLVFLMFVAGISVGIRKLLSRLFLEIEVLKDSVNKLSDIKHEYQEARLPDLIEPDLQEIGQAFNEMLLELQKKETLLMRNQRLTVVGQLSSGVAHEIANPLMGISTLIEELKYDHKKNNHSVELLELIDSQIIRIKKILERLQLLVKGDVNVQLQCEPLHLSEFVQRCLDSIELERPTSHAIYQLVANVPDDLMIEADGFKLQQVISNLVNNAIDAGEDAVIVQLNVKDLGAKIEFSVVDNGKGIAKAMLERAFEPFYTNKGESGIMGTGLGLSIVKEIVVSHKGEISIDSEEGKGTRVRFCLPKYCMNQEEMNAV